MSSVLIIGGGVAGLSAAVDCVTVGWHVTLCEQRSFCGGRAYSFREPVTGAMIDNGQHLFMGCYRATFDYLQKIGAADGVTVEAKLRVPLVDAAGRAATLDCPGWPPPWHLLAGLWRLRGFSKRSLWQLMRKLPSPLAGEGEGEGYAQFDHLSIADWLDQLGQDAAARAIFWTPLVLAVCNETPERASAAPLRAVMHEVFARKNTPMGLAFPRRNLSTLLVHPALAWLRARGADVREATTVEAILHNHATIAGVRLRGGAILHADTYISALPPRPLLTAMSANGGTLLAGWERLREWQGVPILSVHCWFDRPVMDVPMLGLIGSRFHWVFNKGNCIALVASAVREEATWPRERVIAEATHTVRQYLPAARDAKILHIQVTKELEATVSIAPGTAALRLPTHTPWPNFFLAGDWTNTGLPATIESAVRSGQSAAAAAVNRDRMHELQL